MLKFVEGKVSGVEMIALFLNNTSVSHLDIVKRLRIQPDQAGYCHVTDTHFFQPYGEAKLIQMDCEGLDVVEFNKRIKQSLILDYKFCINGKDITVWVITESSPMLLDESSGIMRKLLDIPELVEAVESEYKERFNA